MRTVRIANQPAGRICRQYGSRMGRSLRSRNAKAAAARTVVTNTSALPLELEPVVASLLDRHLSTAQEWFPHDLVPWSLGRDFTADDQWNEGQSRVSAVARDALFVNLLTEDNLPYYFESLYRVRKDGPWGEW